MQQKYIKKFKQTNEYSIGQAVISEADRINENISDILFIPLENKKFPLIHQQEEIFAFIHIAKRFILYL